MAYVWPNPGDQPSPLDIKSMGNEMYKSKKYLGATEFYTWGLMRIISDLDPSSPMAAVGADLLSNLTMSALKTGQRHLAVFAAQAHALLRPQSTKACHRYVVALLSSDQVYLAREAGQQFLSGQKGRGVEPGEETAELRKLVKIAEVRMKEANSPSKALSRRTDGLPDLPAPYLGPIALRRMGERGVGVVALEAVEKGALLMACPPFNTRSPPKQAPAELAMVISLSSQYRRSLLHPSDKLIDGAYPKDLGYELSRLAGGEGAAGPQNLSMMLRACSLSEEDASTFRMVYNVSNANGFKTTDFNHLPQLGTSHLKREYTAVYPHLSYQNHSCWPNTVHNEVGWWREVRAARNIQAGEELTTHYVTTEEPRGERQATLKEQFGFDCECKACVRPKADGGGEAGDEEEGIPEDREAHLSGYRCPNDHPVLLPSGRNPRCPIEGCGAQIAWRDADQWLTELDRQGDLTDNSEEATRLFPGQLKRGMLLTVDPRGKAAGRGSKKMMRVLEGIYLIARNIMAIPFLPHSIPLPFKPKDGRWWLWEQEMAEEQIDVSVEHLELVLGLACIECLKHTQPDWQKNRIRFPYLLENLRPGLAEPLMGCLGGRELVESTTLKTEKTMQKMRTIPGYHPSMG